MMLRQKEPVILGHIDEGLRQFDQRRRVML